MGGGKKKRSLTQMAKAQDRDKSKSEGAKPGGTPSGKERRTRIVPPNPEDKGVIKELQKMKVLTPYSVASRYNIRLSTAKVFLEELHHRGVITYVSGGRNIKIYKPSE